MARIAYLCYNNENMPFSLLMLPQAKKRVEKHRLFIAFPMFLLLLGVSVLSGVQAQVAPPANPMDGTVLTIEKRPETLILANAIAARLLPGTIIVRDDAAPILSEGEGVFAAADCFSVSLGTFTAQGCGGAMHIKRQGADISVSALTTPVLIHSSSGTALIPVHRMWSAPVSLHSLEQGIQRWVTERMTQEMTLDALRIQLPAAEELLSDVPTIDPQSLQTFASTSTGWLISAFHPGTRDLAWTLPQPEMMTKEQYLLSLANFLPADILPEAYSTVAFDRWAEAVKMYLSVDTDIAVRVAIQEQAKAISAEEMPERAERVLAILPSFQ